MDKLEFALQIMVLGFLVVLVTLFLLYVILLLFNRLFSQPGKESSSQAPAAEQKSPANKEEAVVNETITAAVMAAVYRYMQIEETGDHKYSLRINVQPSGSGSVMNWQMVGRRILLENRIKLEQSRRNKKNENV